MKETNLRQADANVTVEGLVYEIALEEKRGDKGNTISGTINIKTSDVNFVR